MLGAWKARLLLSLLEAYRIMPRTADVQCVHACWKSKMLMGLDCLVGLGKQGNWAGFCVLMDMRHAAIVPCVYAWPEGKECWRALKSRAKGRGLKAAQ